MITTVRRGALFAGLLAVLGFAWVPAGDLGSVRYRHRATLLASGRVLVVGGAGDEWWLKSALVFEPPATWRAVGSLAEARYWHSQTRLADGRVLVAGGHPGPLAS